MKILRPTESYEIILPDLTIQKDEGAVTSLWQPDSHVALQLSSYLRTEGDQIAASRRLDDRISKSQTSWKPKSTFESVWARDFAAATTTDSQGFAWTHVYLVWPDLTIYATVAKPSYEGAGADDWAFEALANVKRTAIS